MALKTESFRNHHGEVRTLVGRIEQLLDLPSIRADAAPVSTVLRELFGKFGVHLAIEDTTLYPRMIAHADGQLRQIAERFQREMGNIRTRFDAYRNRWPGPLAIARDPEAFVAETREVLTALRQRMACEDAELYDLYDRAV